MNKGKKIGVVLTIAVLVAALGTLVFLGVTKSFVRIEAGEVGVVYNLNGGVKEPVLTQGFQIISPFENVTKYNTSQEQLLLTDTKPADVDEDDFEDHHIDGVAKGGGAIKVNLQVNYKFDEDRVVDIYKQFKGKSGEYIVEHYMANKIISETKGIIANYSIEELYPVSDDINKEIKEKLDEELSKTYGIRIVEANIVKTTPSEEVMKKIDAKVQAKQEKEKAELDKQTAIAQADTNKSKAEGEANVAITKAKGQAESNRIISESITDKLIQMKEMEARAKHGWITVQGADSVVVKDK